MRLLLSHLQFHQNKIVWNQPDTLQNYKYVSLGPLFLYVA